MKNAQVFAAGFCRRFWPNLGRAMVWAVLVIITAYLLGFEFTWRLWALLILSSIFDDITFRKG